MTLQRKLLSGAVLCHPDGTLARTCCCVHEVMPDVFSPDTAWFLGGATLPAGTYRVTYVSGALRYSGSTQWTVNWPGGDPTNYRVVYDDGASVLSTPLVDGGWHPSIAAVEAANAGKFVTVQHAGGRIGVRYSDAQYSDNVGPGATWRLSVD